MLDFGLVQSFGIDNSELDSATRETVFLLGVEFGMVACLLSSGSAFTQPVHAQNRARLENCVLRAGRQHTWKWLGDPAEEWVLLTVREKDGIA